MKINKMTLIAFTMFIVNAFFSQNSSYYQAWEKLNTGNLAEAKELFKKATDEDDSKEQANLVLSILHNDVGEIDKSSKYFKEFFINSENPLPESFALWYNESVKGSGVMTPNQKINLGNIVKHPKSNEYFGGVVNYYYGLDRSLSQDEKGSNIYFDKIGQLTKFSLLGPFDNLVNNGFDKDFGALDLNNKKFSSKYGTDVSWFTPRDFYNDGYFLYDRYFVASNSLIYAQTFVDAPEQQDVFLKFGYSGIAKLWVNDSLVYSESNKRVTEMDYYQISLTLNKGHNRILVQLGKYDRVNANFSLRITDKTHNTLIYPHTSEVQNYNKGVKNVSLVPYSAITDLKLKINERPDDILYKLLLIKTHLRALELDEAEEIADELYSKYPQNYMVLRQLIFLNERAAKGTLQNKYYELFKEAYPLDRDILSNEIKKTIDEKDIPKLEDLIATYKKLYPDNKKDVLAFDLTMSTMREDYNKAVEIIDRMYVLYPNDASIVASKFHLDKALKSDVKKSIKILENFHKTKYDYSILTLLVDEYSSLGNTKKVKDYLTKSISMTKFDENALSKMSDLHFKNGDYESAIAIYNSILQNRPTDNYTYNDLASLYQIKGDNDKALENYKKSLSFYPFSFDVNEKIRVLNSEKAILSQIETATIDEILFDYKKNFVTNKKASYEIVYNSESKVIYSNSAAAKVILYVVKLNNEDALKQWQKIDLGSAANFYFDINEAKTIKSNGSKIDAERNRYSVVFTNLEVGDFIFLKYTEKQYSGGKSSKFFSDHFSFSSYYPAYKLKYALYTQEGVQISDTMINGKIEPVVTNVDGFTKKEWQVVNPEVIADEPFMLPFSDVSNRLHIAATYTWDDVTDWYNDLSKDQALVDYTVKDISNKLFKEGNYSEIEKARMIYDFILKNIQYSSIDFRQGSYIPQKASDVYVTRLGDCKDVSTLYATIARNVGLNVDLVLINTSNNGTLNVLQPSLNFNHCIVKVNLKDGPLYLELTDPNLPFGHLNNYHKNAAILDIPFGAVNSKGNTIKSLDYNKGYVSSINRNTNLAINNNGGFNITCKTTKIGEAVTGAVSSYYEKDSTDQINILKDGISGKFKSLVTVNSIDLVDMEPRKDTVVYLYNYDVENEVNKLGSMNSIKIPFADKLLSSNLFESKKRVNVLNYIKYEDVNKYHETMEIIVPDNFSFVELPENMDISYGKFSYKLTFNLIANNKLSIVRTFIPELRNIQPEELPEFQEFMTKVLNAESTYLVYK